MDDGEVVAALFVAAVSAIAVLLVLWDRTRLVAQNERLLSDLRDERERRDSREREWTERFVSMRVEHGFTAGGETAPEPPLQIPEEAERFIQLLPPEVQYEQREWVRDRLRAEVPVPQIMMELEDGMGIDELMGVYGD